MDSEKLETVVSGLADLVNNMAFDYPAAAETIAEALVKKHRTLQQSSIRLVALSIKRYSELIKERYGTDMRNEAAADWAEEISKIDSYFPHI